MHYMKVVQGAYITRYNVSYCHESIHHKCVSYGCKFCTKSMRKIYVILGRFFYPEHAISLHFIYWEIGVGRVVKGRDNTISVNISTLGLLHKTFTGEKLWLF